MKQKITLNEVMIGEDEILLKYEGELDITKLRPVQQMLVDSDNLSFIYLAEYDDEYLYIVIPEIIWVELKQLLTSNFRVLIEQEARRLHLPAFREEFTYLLENIKGNSNYGEEMVAKVEDLFNLSTK